MYQVLENNKPARYPEIDLHPSWNQFEFNTWIEAKEYADNYLGIYGPFAYDYPKAYAYNGYDVIEIKEIKK